ncbi:MAG TPA: phage Gp37/Gp68 family protein [Anaerolineaceae bacterium]|nr:phage Gp37/Gp68 family protein [Anaerolineaceae bacterium]
MKKTKIEWADVVWNPVTGCTKVSDGCRNCYAERLAKRFWGERKFTDVRCHPERLAEADKFGKTPQRVFVNSMSDLFHPDVTMGFVCDVITEMIVHPTHTFMVLTKRPDQMLDVMRYYGASLIQDARNIWWGVSAENQATADERIPLLLKAPVAVRFVSCEPLLGPVDFRLKKGSYVTNALTGFMTTAAEPMLGNKLDWVICGGESGPNARPMHPDWVRDLRDQCNAAGVPFLFKQWGEWAPDCLCDTPTPCREIDRPQPGLMGCMFRCGKKNAGRELDGRTWDEYPEVEEW